MVGVYSKAEMVSSVSPKSLPESSVDIATDLNVGSSVVSISFVAFVNIMTNPDLSVVVPFKVLRYFDRPSTDLLC